MSCVRRRPLATAELNVLVLGVGGNVSQGILKALAMSSLSCRVVGACISPLAAGLFTSDRAHVSPRADAPEFLDWLIDICRAERIDAVLSGVEPVLCVLSAHADRIHAGCGAICIVSPPDCLAIGDDKLRTAQWLETSGLNFPSTVAAEDFGALDRMVAEYGFPLLAKPRGGKSATGVLEIRETDELQWIARRPGYVVQELLGDADTEYTVGCFSDRNGTVRGAIAMRRDLLEGTTLRAEAGDFPEVRAEAIRIAERLNPMGPCNVQMRLHQGRPVCFEINIRFSGTTPLRARLGFNEVEAALRHYVLGEDAVELPLITEGIALRYWNEMYVDPAAARVLSTTGRLDDPQQYPVVVEDYGMR